MSHDIRMYWQAVRAVEQTLPEFVWLTAGNAVTQVPAAIAAKLLHAGSHRVSTGDEIASQLSREKSAAKQAKHDRMRRAGQAVVVVEETVVEEAEASPDQNAEAAVEAKKSAPARRRRR